MGYNPQESLENAINHPWVHWRPDISWKANVKQTKEPRILTAGIRSGLGDVRTFDDWKQWIQVILVPFMVIFHAEESN